MICAEILFPKIGRAFSVFETFMAQSKIASAAPLILTQPTPKVEYRGNTPIQIGWSNFHCEFVATRSPKTRMKYALKIFANQFDEKPCFRFCSSAHTHINHETGDGLPGRSIPTPHFHTVDNDGILRAFQTPPLEDPVESVKISSDPQLGTNHFCQVANLFSPSGGSIVLQFFAAEFDLSTADPLDGATFPP